MHLSFILLFKYKTKYTGNIQHIPLCTLHTQHNIYKTEINQTMNWLSSFEIKFL